MKQILLNMISKLKGRKALPSVNGVMESFHETLKKLEEVGEKHRVHAKQMEARIAAAEAAHRLSTKEVALAARTADKIRDLISA